MERDGSITAEAERDAGMLASKSLGDEVGDILAELGVPRERYASGSLFARSPIDGSRIGKLQPADFASIDSTLKRASEAACAWSAVPPPHRSTFVRCIGDHLRDAREPLARLVTLETGKPIEESRREVKFAIDRCDLAFASGREIGQSMMRAERKSFWIQETWRSLGVTGCISPFNRPVSHFAGPCFVSLVCGNAMVWKPSQRAPLCALALHTVLETAARETGGVPDGLVGVLFGGRDVGKALAEDHRLRFLDAATSIAAGRSLNTVMARAFTRGALSLGGNNAAIICSSADVNAAINAVVSSIALSNGQHSMCTRRLFVHTDLYACFVKKLKQVLARIPVGDPRSKTNMMGPLIDSDAFEEMQRLLTIARNGGAVVTGGTRIDRPDSAGGYYVSPAIVEMPVQSDLMLRESLVPVLFVTPFKNLTDAMKMDRASESGMASALFTHNMSEVDDYVRFTDCGMVNINTLHAAGHAFDIAPAGARASGGGRLPSTASWKVFMQRSIVSINMSNKDEVPDTLGMIERGEI